VDLTRSRVWRALYVSDSRRAVLDCGKRRTLSLRSLVEAIMSIRRTEASKQCVLGTVLGEDRDKRLASVKK
jgi:hypothetical protein